VGRPASDPNPNTPEWLDLLAASASYTPCRSGGEEWFADDPKLQRRAAQLCTGCPLLEACRNYALAAYEPNGVWGGLTPADRKRLRRERRRAA